WRPESIDFHGKSAIRKRGFSPGKTKGCGDWAVAPAFVNFARGDDFGEVLINQTDRFFQRADIFDGLPADVAKAHHVVRHAIPDGVVEADWRGQWLSHSTGHCLFGGWNGAGVRQPGCQASSVQLLDGRVKQLHPA